MLRVSDGQVGQDLILRDGLDLISFSLLNNGQIVRCVCGRRGEITPRYLKAVDRNSSILFIESGSGREIDFAVGLRRWTCLLLPAAGIFNGHGGKPLYLVAVPF